MAIDFSDLGGVQVADAPQPLDFSDLGGVKVSSPKTDKSYLNRVVDTGLKLFGVPDELAGEATRVAAQGYPFRLPEALRQIPVNNQFLTSNEKPASFVGELTGLASGTAAAAREKLKGGSAKEAFSKEVFRPKDQPGDLPAQVAAAFVAPEVANAPFNAAVKVGEKVAAPVGKLATLLSSLGTNVEGANYKTIYKNPEGMLPGALDKASQSYEKALLDSGIDPRKVNKERISSLTNSEPYAFGNYADLQEKGSISPEKALYSRQAIDKIYPIPNKKNASYRKLLDKMKDSFNDVLDNSTPKIQAASKEYRVAKAGQSFKSPLPLTSSGKPGFFRGAAMEEMARRPIMEALRTGNALEALKSLSVIPMVPAVAGGVTAGLGLAAKPLGLMANNPFISSALLAALARERMNQNQSNPQ